VDAGTRRNEKIARFKAERALKAKVREKTMKWALISSATDEALGQFSSMGHSGL
jgi:hypothetical protein